MNTMLRFVKNNILWKQTFDAEWKHGSMFFGFVHVGDERTCNLITEKSCQEKRSYWRETLGQRRGLTPKEAAYRSLEDFADTYFKECRNEKGAERSFEDIANALQVAAPYEDRNGRYVAKESYLSDRWKAYYTKYRARRNVENAEQERQAAEIQSVRFGQEEIEAGWSRLCKGDIPPEIRRLWRAAYPRKSAHEICQEANIQMKDFVFWMVVLRQQGVITEDVVLGTHMYCSGPRTGNGNLGEPLATVIATLNN